MRKFYLAIFVMVFLITALLLNSETPLLAQDRELEAMVNELNGLERYEGKKIGYEETWSESWQLGKKIVAYKEQALPLLLDIYQNSDNIIAQLFAARLVAEIDYIKGIKLLRTFKDNPMTVETIFEDSLTSMTISDIVKKELHILKEQDEKAQSMQSHHKRDI